MASNSLRGYISTAHSDSNFYHLGEGRRRCLDGITPADFPLVLKNFFCGVASHFGSTILLFLKRYKVYLLLLGKEDYSQGESLQLIFMDINGHRIRTEAWKDSYHHVKKLAVSH